MMPRWIESRAGHQLLVRRFGHFPAPREADARFLDYGHRLWPKRIAAPAEAHRLWHSNARQFILDQRQFTRQPRSIERLRKVSVRPRMIADLEAHPVQLGDVSPGHEALS